MLYLQVGTVEAGARVCCVCVCEGWGRGAKHQHLFPAADGRIVNSIQTHTLQLYWLPREVEKLPHWNWPSAYALTASVAPMRTVYLLPE